MVDSPQPIPNWKDLFKYQHINNNNNEDDEMLNLKEIDEIYYYYNGTRDVISWALIGKLNTGRYFFWSSFIDDDDSEHPVFISYYSRQSFDELFLIEDINEEINDIISANKNGIFEMDVNNILSHYCLVNKITSF